MNKIMTQEDVLQRLENKYPGISQRIQEELAGLEIAHKIAEL